MKTIYTTVDGRPCFVIVELDPRYQTGAGGLGFTPSEEGLVRFFPDNLPNMEQIHATFERYGEAMIIQAAGLCPVPWEQALLAFLSAIAGQPINWWLVGSAALAVRGIDVAPQDLDIVTDGAGAQRLGELLMDYLVEPVVNCGNVWISDWWGRAFLHARVEWVGDVHADVDEPYWSDFGPAAAAYLEKLTWRGTEIRVPPLELQLAVSERRGLKERVQRIREHRNHLATRTHK